MKIIGLTGGIGTGKSTVARMLKKRRIPVICADRIAREALNVGHPCFDRVVSTFGKGILNPTRTINREDLARIVFSSTRARRKLNRIVHPYVIREMKMEIARLKKSGKKRVVLDIPLLYEEKLDRICDKVIVVYAPEKMALRRLLKRKGMSGEDARRRLKTQISIEKKKKWADYVIDNSGSLLATQIQVEKCLSRLDAS